MIYFVLIFGVVGYLFGEEPVTKDNIRQLAEHKTTFEIAKPFPKVFDNLMTASNKCYLNQPNEEQITVWGEKNNAHKTANIRIEHVYAMTPHEMYIMVDLKAVGDKTTVVDVYNADDSAKDSLINYKNWADQKPESC